MSPLLKTSVVVLCLSITLFMALSTYIGHHLSKGDLDVKPVVQHLSAVSLVGIVGGVLGCMANAVVYIFRTF